MKLQKDNGWIFLIHFPIVIGFYLLFKLFNMNYYIFFILVFIFSMVVSFLVGKLACFVCNKVLEALNIPSSI